ncbi:dihydroorotase [Roseibium hamelinense]|uniref:Dihydroorotase n=1 Tax=Roseibium hamelinense TaxID=150831 RepID=A0A562TG04_9HYPH|nr:amidohydrolase family protein [Roseibium hamelinense]MTI42439.1 D-glutamate deacylase [Roseibium hamelinense]TWI92462.1 dihydroorotase [Roseibium hamelinense]
MTARKAWRAISTVAVFLASTTAAFANDVVILNGRVIDPETGLDAIRNVGVEDGRISAISEFPLEGDTVIDATGHVVSPGFIDLHAHGQSIGDARMQAMQGVTTQLELESGVLPIGEWYEDQAAKNLPINYGAAAGWTFGRIATFDNTDPLATVAFFQDAQAENDWKMEIADQDQSTRILDLVEQGLREGGLGIGINAGYAPGYGQKEYFALAELANEYGVATYTHVRYASVTEPQSSFEAIKELIANAAITGAHMHICHINSSSLADIEATLSLVEEAQARGINITVEAYPYGAASTVVGAAMFTGPGWRDRMQSTAENFQLGDDRMTEEELEDYQANEPGTFITWHFLDESKPDDLALLDMSITHPATMIASDATFWSYFDEDGTIQTYTGDEWPLPDNVFAHPRSAGAYAKILRSYVRERGLLSMSEAIRKMSLMPAQTLEDFVPQMRRKGRLQVGMDADIVVFDPETIADRATYENANQTAVGVQTVLVNGGFVVRDGSLILDAPHGQPIRREIIE